MPEKNNIDPFNHTNINTLAWQINKLGCEWFPWLDRPELPPELDFCPSRKFDEDDIN